MITAVLVHPDWGDHLDVENAKTKLLGGNEYEVEEISMGYSHTNVYLKGIPGAFNSVQFDFLEDGKPIDIYHDKRFNPCLKEE